MNDPLEQVEQRLAGVRPPGAPAELRGAVLAGVRRELAAARWDRRLARVALVLLAVGVGMNAMLALRPDAFVGNRSARAPSQQTLVAAAATVAEATDAATGIRFAHQLAALGGVALSSEQSSAIDAAARGRAAHHSDDGKDG